MVKNVARRPQLTIFLRLALGYLFVFTVIGGTSLYAFMKLSHANREGANAIIRDESLLDQKKKLVDSLLMQVNFEKKFVITGETTFQDRLTNAREDFSLLLDKAMGNAHDFPEQRTQIMKISQLFQAYRNATAGGPAEEGQRQRDSLVDSMLDQLKALENATHANIGSNLRRMEEAGDSARRLNSFIWVGALCLMVATGYFTTRSVTKPVSVLLTKTGEVAKGIFKGDLAITSPPEVAQLARSFNSMCEKLQAAEKMKKSFLSVMSHELRTPLTSIKEGIGLLQDGAGGSTTDKQNRLLTILSQETTRMIGLVNSLLDLSRMQQGMMPYDFSDERLPLLVEQVATELAPLAEAKRITLVTDSSCRLPLLRIDRERILQAVRNLVGNALKFTPEGGTVSVVLSAADGSVRLAVSDTGPGIPQESLDTIFEEFRQLPGSYPGSGLGLAIVKEIVGAHGGKVWAESTPGSGSILTFVLPLQSVAS
jgi:two-component system, NtrC family, sensor histidine kinase GlrK